MKRILYTLAAVATFASCSNDELVEVTPKQAITFGNAFVENATRAIDNTYNNNNLFTAFKVYGTVKSSTLTNAETVNIFNGVEVKNESNDWNYASTYTQYWVADCSYDFAAIVDGETVKTDDNGIPVSITYDASTQKDLCYATATASTGNDAIPTTGVNDNKEVNFTFNHLLAKAQFTVKNAITTNTEDAKYTYRVTELKITNPMAKGVYKIGSNPSWQSQNTHDSYAAEFGNVTDATISNASTEAVEIGEIGKEASATSHNQMLLIPYNYDEDKKMELKCQIETLLNGKVINKKSYYNSVSVNIEAGHYYNFIITLKEPGEKIEFTVQTLTGWTPENGTDTPITEKQ